MPDEPDYKVYRSRRSPFSGLRDRLRRARESEPESERPKKRKRLRRKKPEAKQPDSRRLRWRQIAKWSAIALAGWIALSVVLFFISAQLSSSRLDSEAKDALSSPGNPLLKAQTILMLGSDRRKGEGGRGRSDTLLLMRFDGGKSSKLSIPRDTRVTIPGFGQGKINSAYAIGGAALTIKTIEFNFPPIRVNHIIEVNFEGFSDFVDALGGVKMSFGNCIVSTFEGKTLRVSKGTHELDGETALGVVRTRKNRCAPNENDLTRARRQQQFLDAVKSRLFGPMTFVRLPWVAWAAPGAFESDMKGVRLASLFIEMQRASAAKPHVLPVAPAGFGSDLVAKDPEYKAVVEQFMDAE